MFACHSYLENKYELVPTDLLALGSNAKLMLSMYCTAHTPAPFNIADD